MLILQRKHAIELSSLTNGSGTVEPKLTSVEYANNALSYYSELNNELRCKCVIMTKHNGTACIFTT